MGAFSTHYNRASLKVSWVLKKLQNALNHYLSYVLEWVLTGFNWSAHLKLPNIWDVWVDHMLLSKLGAVFISTSQHTVCNSDKRLISYWATVHSAYSPYIWLKEMYITLILFSTLPFNAVRGLKHKRFFILWILYQLHPLARRNLDTCSYIANR